jgi:hypothetical protein
MIKAIAVLQEVESALSACPEANVLYLGISTFKELVGYKPIKHNWTYSEGSSRRLFMNVCVFVVNANHHVHASIQ